MLRPTIGALTTSGELPLQVELPDGVINASRSKKIIYGDAPAALVLGACSFCRSDCVARPGARDAAAKGG